MKTTLNTSSTLLVAIAALLLPAFTLAESETIGDYTWSYSINGETATVTGVSPANGAITIPSSLGGYPVTSIFGETGYRAGAFSGCSGLTSVTIIDGVTGIGDFAFFGCSGLTSVTIPASVTSLDGYNIFNGCRGIRDVTVPGRVQMRYLFPSSYSSITNVTVADGVTSIWQEAFYGCSSLTSVTIPNSVTGIGDYAFYGCSGLTTVTIPDSVTSIGGRAFYNCSGLTSLTIPNSVTYIGNEAFSYCSGLTSVTIPASVTRIWDGLRYPFNGCSGIRDVTVPGQFQMGYLFPSSYSSITNVTVADGVTGIGDYAFYGCSGLTTVTIPDSVTSIGGRAFYGCSSLTSVTIPDSVTSIGDNAFFGCSSLTSVAIPNSVTSIGSYAFFGCGGLMSVSIPDSVTSIGSVAFYGCDSLTYLQLPPRFKGNTSNMDIPSGCTVSFHGFCDLAVASDYGDPVPGIGRNTIEVFVPTTISCHVNGIQETDSQDVRHFCTGWTGTGSVPASGTGTNVTFEILDDSSITWLWETNVWIECSIAGDATPSGDGSGWFVNDGADAAFQFTPGADPFWTTLSGDADGVSVDRESGTVTVPADRPRSVGLRVFTSRNVALAAGGKPLAAVPADANAPWFAVEDGTATDGFALRSGAVEAGGTNAVEMSLAGSGTLSFNWKVPAGRGDYARFYLDGELKKSIQRATSWQSFSVEVPAGSHTARWAYERGAGSASGLDTAFLDDVDWRPDVSLSVASAFGTPSPSVGAHTMVYGDAVSAGVAEPAPANGTRRVCMGWTGTGSVPASGAGTAVLFSITNDSSIVWNWRTDRWIDVAVSGGSADFAPQWVEDGAQVAVALSPATHLYRITLSGDTEGATLDGTTLRFAADGPRTIAVAIDEVRLSLAVESEWGVPEPTNGVHAVSWGTRVEASVVAPEPTNGVQYVCAGWTGAGSVPAAGATNEVAFTVEEDSTLAWNWTTNVWVALEAEGIVATDFTGAWTPLGGEVVANWFPLAESYGVSLSGDTDGVALDEEAGTLSISADRPRAVRLSVKAYSLATALDAPGLAWATDGTAPWTPQDAASHDGEDAAMSGAVLGDDTSALETTLTGPGTLSWWWRLDSDGNAGVDVLLDGEWLEDYWPGDVWSGEELEIAGEGEHTVRFEFWNVGSAATAGDCALIDEVSWSGAGGGGAFTKTTEEPVAHDWLDRHGLVRGGDYEGAASGIASNGWPVWKCYVADLDPTNAMSQFMADIEIVDGRVVVTWEPDSEDRVYVVEGREALDDAAGWVSPTNAASRFFRVKVSLPEGHGAGGGEAGFPGAVTVTLDPNGGEVDPSSLRFTASGTLGFLPDATGGWPFAGWFSRRLGGVRFTELTAVPWMDTTLYAHWRGGEVRFAGGEGGAMEPAEFHEDGETVVLPPCALSKTGHSFAGWATEPGGAAVYADGASVPLSGSVTLYATWGVNQYTVSFDTAGGSAVAPITLDYGAAVTPPDSPARERFSFAGWQPPVPATMPPSNVVCVAQWARIPHSIAFDAAGGEGAMEGKAFYEDEDSVVLLACSFTKVGHSFAGWATEPGGAAVYADEAGISPSGDTTLYAVWSVNQYTIEFEMGDVYDFFCDDWQTESITQNFGTAVADPGYPNTEGWWTFDALYVFDGWEPAIPATMPPSNLVCAAQWTPIRYNIHFDANGGLGEMADFEYDFDMEEFPYQIHTYDGGSIPLPNCAFTRTGHTFRGWSLPNYDYCVFGEDTSSTAFMVTQHAWPYEWPWETGSMPETNVTLRAVWSGSGGAVHFDAGGGDGTMTPETYSSDGDSVVLQGCGFQKDGYSFAGWATEPGGEVVYTDGAEFAPDGDIVLYAVWQVATNDWFSVDFSDPGYSIGENWTNVASVAAPGGTWRAADDESRLTESNGVRYVALNNTAGIAYTPSTPSETNSIVRVSGNILPVAFGGSISCDTNGIITALAFTTRPGGGDGLVAHVWADGSWVELATPASVRAGIWLDYVLEFNLATGSAPRMRLSLCGETLTTASGGEEWVSLGSASVDRIREICFSGSGGVGSFSGTSTVAK